MALLAKRCDVIPSSELAKAARGMGLDADGADMIECDESGVTLQFTKGEHSSLIRITPDELSDPTCDMAASFKPIVARDLGFA